MDFLEKPIDDNQLFNAVATALALDTARRKEAATGAEMRDLDAADTRGRD